MAYVRGQFIGAGGFGQVYKYKKNNNELVGKHVSTPCDDHEEHTVMKMMTSNKYVVKYIDTRMHDETTRVIFMEYCSHGNMLDLINEQRMCQNTMTLHDVQKTLRFNLKVFYMVCKGVKSMHEKGVVHHDIKPENVFLANNKWWWKDVIVKLGFVSTKTSKDVIAKLGDFGMASRGKCTDSMGTRGHMAPEVLAKELHGIEADVWSMGVMLHQLMHFGDLPFGKPKSKADLIMRVAQNVQTNPVCEQLFPTIYDVLTRMLQLDRSKRVDMTVVKSAIKAIIVQNRRHPAV